jgi:hypothetical protein
MKLNFNHDYGGSDGDDSTMITRKIRTIFHSIAAKISLLPLWRLWISEIDGIFSVTVLDFDGRNSPQSQMK